MINKKILGLIGFAARTRKIVFGADSVEADIRTKKVKIALIAEEASDRTKEKFKNLCEKYDIPYIIKGDIDTLSKAIGKSNKAIIGVKEENLANEIKKINDGGDIIG